MDYQLTKYDIKRIERIIGYNLDTEGKSYKFESYRNLPCAVMSVIPHGQSMIPATRINSLIHTGLYNCDYRFEVWGDKYYFWKIRNINIYDIYRILGEYPSRKINQNMFGLGDLNIKLIQVTPYTISDLDELQVIDKTGSTAPFLINKILDLEIIEMNQNDVLRIVYDQGQFQSIYRFYPDSKFEVFTVT